jgi:hypothetical protein
MSAVMMTEEPSVEVVVRFFINADAEPGLLPRLLQPFAKRDLTPDTFLARCTGDEMDVEIALNSVPRDIVHLIEGNLRQIIGVRHIKRFEPSISRLRSS